MNIPLKGLFGALFAVFFTPAVANVATTAGNNLTAYNGTGATNNNQWNSLMNSRVGAQSSTPKADFGNCNASILRCATPKCASGGCTEMSVARPIVAGCVSANAACKKHGDALIDTITAQIVAQSVAKVREQENAVAIAQAQAQAQADAAANAAAQSNAQMQAMQSQMAAMQQQMAESMSAMQEQMAAQSESQNAQIQNALSARETYAPSSGGGQTAADVVDIEGLSTADRLAMNSGVNPELLVREQIGGKVETAIEDAMVQMKHLKETLDRVLEYAGCDSSANMCTGPKRVKKFKELVNSFFDPYEAVLDSTYDALVLAMSAGIDVADAVMLLSGACNMWGRYLCDKCDYGRANCIADNAVCSDDDVCYYRVATDGTGRVNKNQPHCRLIEVLNDNADVQREWLDGGTGMMGATQVACASDVINNAGIFRGRRKETNVGIEDLRTMLSLDSNSGACASASGSALDYDKCQKNIARCMVKRDSSAETGYWEVLEKAVNTKNLPVGVSDKSWCRNNNKPYPLDGSLTVVEEPLDCYKLTTETCRNYPTSCEVVSGKCVTKTKTGIDTGLMNIKLNFDTCSFATGPAVCNSPECEWKQIGSSGKCVKKTKN